MTTHKPVEKPIKIGDRVVVANHFGIEVRVKAVKLENGGRAMLILDWGMHGTSRVYAHDEGSTWYRYEDYPQIH